MSATAPMPIVLLAWKPLVKGALRGFASIQLGKSLRIMDIPVLCSNGKMWASLPSKPLIGDGKALVDARGKQRYSPILEWADRATSDRFSRGVVDAVIAAHGAQALEPAA